MTSPRSRRVMLALGALAFGLSSCGDPSTSTSTGAASSSGTTIVAPDDSAKPPVIKIAGGSAGGRGVAASAEAAPALDPSASKMSYAALINYVFDGEAPTFDGPSGAWYFPVGAVPSDEQLRKLGAAFGFTDAPKPVPEDQGGGWMFGVTDGTGAGLQVTTSSTLDWWYYPDPTSARPQEGCAEVIEPGDPANPETGVTQLVCPEPTPPVGVPSDDEALAKARELFGALGLDLAGYDLAVMGDDWGRTVTVTQLLDGHKSPVAQSVGFGENGAVTWAGGMLAQPVRGADYPRISVTDAVQRLNDQSASWGPMVRGGVVLADSGNIAVDSAGGVAVDPALGAPEISPEVMPELCVDPAVLAAQTGVAVEPAQATAGGAGSTEAGAAIAVAPPDVPTDPVVTVALPLIDPSFGCEQITPPEPITVHLTGVTEGLTMVWATDNTVWLLPSYDFTSGDGGQYQINAVADGFIENVPVEATPAPEPVPVPDVPAVATVEAAAALVGLLEAEASDLALANGWTMRVVQRDGESLAVTEDFSDSRVNVAVEGDKVTAVINVG